MASLALALKNRSRAPGDLSKNAVRERDVEVMDKFIPWMEKLDENLKKNGNSMKKKSKNPYSGELQGNIFNMFLDALDNEDEEQAKEEQKKSGGNFDKLPPLPQKRPEKLPPIQIRKPKNIERQNSNLSMSRNEDHSALSILPREANIKRTMSRDRKHLKKSTGADYTDIVIFF